MTLKKKKRILLSPLFGAFPLLTPLPLTLHNPLVMDCPSEFKQHFFQVLKNPFFFSAFFLKVAAVKYKLANSSVQEHMLRNRNEKYREAGQKYSIGCKIYLATFRSVFVILI